MNKTYDPVNDCSVPPGKVQQQAANASYIALRQALYDLLANYSQPDAVAALSKTLAEWQS